MSSTTLTVSAGGDDAQESDGTVVSVTSGALDCDSVGDMMAFIIRNIPVPAGSYIVDAWVNVYPTNSGRQSPNVTIRGEHNPASLVATNGNLSGRTKTTSGASWVATNIGINSYKSSPSIADVIQEIVDNGVYTEDDDIALFLIQNSSSGWLRIAPYEDGSGTKAPQLYLEWEPGTDDLTYGFPTNYWPGRYWSEYFPDYGTSGSGTIIPLVIHHLIQQGVG